MLKSKHVVPAIELLGIGSLTAVGLFLGGPIGATVMASIGINLSSNLLEGAKTKLKEKWLKSEYGALNHDIQHALVRAFVNALNYRESEYFKTEQATQLPRDEKRAIRGLFKSLRTDAAKMFVDVGDDSSGDDLRSLLDQEPAAADAQLWSQIGETEPFLDLNDHFKAFLRHKLFKQVVAQFGEELKSDNKKSNRAWRAFERLLLENIQADVEDVKASQSVIADAIDTGFAEFRKLKGVAVVVGRIEQKVDAVADAVDGVTENVTESVSARLAAASAVDAQYLLEHSCELSNRGEVERALELVEEATRLARRLKNQKLERACLLHEANVLFWYGTDDTHTPRTIVDRLQRIIKQFGRLGQATSHAFQIKLHLSRLLGDHEETIANSRAILKCDDDFVDAQMEAVSALLIALAQLGRTAEIDGLVEDINRLAERCDPDQEATLRMNWLMANADIDRFQQGAIDEFIALMETATSVEGFTMALASDGIRRLGSRLQRAADRTSSPEWCAAAHKLYVWAYQLAEQTEDAKRAIEFCEQLASLSVDFSGERSEALEWIKKGELTLSWPTRFENPEARLANQCFFTYAKARVLWRLTTRYDRPNDQLMREGLLCGALKAFQEAAELFERCRGAIDGDADLLAGDRQLAQGQICVELGKYEQALTAFRKIWEYPSFWHDAQRPFWAGTRQASLMAEFGDFNGAWAIYNMLDKHPNLAPELRNQLGEFHSYLKYMEAKDGKRARVVVPIVKPKDE